jgi:putative transposase
MYALYLYFLGLSFRSTAKALDPFVENRSHVAVWNWVQLFHPNKFYLKRTRVTAFIIDETMLQIGSEYAWLWVAIEPVHKQVLGVYISRHRNMLVAESFLRSLIKVYGKHTVYSDGGTWYPEACSYLGLKHLLHSPLEKSIIEEQLSFSKIELKVLMITIHANTKLNTNCHTYTTGSVCLCSCIMQTFYISNL